MEDLNMSALKEEGFISQGAREARAVSKLILDS